MSLPNIRELLHLVPAVKEAGGEHVAQTVEHQIPSNIAQHVTEATGQVHTVENITPVINQDPLAVINPLSGQADADTARRAEIKMTMPEGYESPETGWGPTADRVLLNKPGLTVTTGFRGEIEKRNQAQSEVKQQVAEEVKKAA